MSFLRPTLKDVAKLSGVSEISVSRVMRNAPNISSRLREKVEAAALELHYTPNKVAGALASNTTDLIGVVVPTLKNIEYVQILSGIESILGQSQYRMMLGVSDFSSKREIKIVRDLLSWSPSGIIMVGDGHSDDTYQLVDRSLSPLIEILNQEKSSAGFRLEFSYQDAVDELVAHWRNKGYEKIACIESSDKQLALSGFKRYLKEKLASIGAKLVHEIQSDKNSSAALGVECCSAVLQKYPDVDAIFLLGKHFAEDTSFYDSVNITSKVALASVGNIANLGEGPLSVDLISFPFEKIGVDAAKLLLSGSKKDQLMKQKQIKLPAKFYRHSI
jgi:LacI family gluconate utilization system Gnt-I transcriptional repressor